MRNTYYLMAALILSTLFQAPMAFAYSRYEWRKDYYGTVYCAEVTPNGDQIQKVQNDTCRRNIGSQYAWKKDYYGTVYCAELTPAGDQIQKVENNVCRQGGGTSSYRWERNPRGGWDCVEYDYSGRFIGYAPGALCDHPPGRDGLGTRLEWKKDYYGTVYCAELTPTGDQIQKVDMNQCRQALGIMNDWKKDYYGTVYCAEMTPAGDQIQKVENNVCRAEVGSYYDWKKDYYGVVYCAELTRNGDQIGKVDNNYCR
jgi:hypothetical protein